MKKILSGILMIILALTCVKAFAIEVVRQKNVATYVVFPIIKNDGTLITGASGLDSEIDEFSDGSAPTGFADCTNEATEIGSTGNYYLSLTQSEMNQDYLIIQVKSSTTGALTQVLEIRTMIGDPLNVATHQSGRELDVASTGEAGMDLSNVNGTLDAAEIGSAAITSAKFASGAIDATAIATDAIGAAEIAADAIGSSELATDAIGAAELAADSITSSEVADGAIDAGALATDTITAAKIAADSIGASEIATDAIGSSELAQAAADKAWSTTTRSLTILDEDSTTLDLDGTTIGTVTNVSDKTGYRLSATGIDDVWEETVSGHTTAGTFGRLAQVIRDATAQAGASGTITLDASASGTDDFYNNTIIQIISGTGANQSRIISDYVGSTKVATVNGNWATNPSSDSVFVIRPFGAIPGASAPTAGEVADAVWEEALADHEGTSGSTAEALATAGGSGASAADIADAVLDEALAGHTTSGTVGERLGRIPNAAAGANGGLPTVDSNNAVKVQAGTGTGQLDFTSGRVKADTVYWNAVAVATPDASGYPKVTIKSGTGTGEVSLSSGSVVAASVTGNVGGNVTGSIGSLAAQAKADVNAEVDAALDTAIPGTPTSNSINERIKTLDDAYTSARAANLDNLDASVSTRSTVTTAQVNTEVDTALSDIKLDKLLSATSTVSSDVALGSVVGQMLDAGTSWSFDRSTDSLEAIRDRGDSAWTGGGSLTAADIWSYNISAYSTAGLAGTYLKGAGAAGDPWLIELPGSYTGSQAGYYLQELIKKSR